MTRRIVLSEDESDSDTPLRAAVKADLPIGANGAASNGHGKRKHSSTISAAAASPSSSKRSKKGDAKAPSPVTVKKEYKSKPAKISQATSEMSSDDDAPLAGPAKQRIALAIPPGTTNGTVVSDRTPLAAALEAGASVASTSTVIATKKEQDESSDDDIPLQKKRPLPAVPKKRKARTSDDEDGAFVVTEGSQKKRAPGKRAKKTKVKEPDDGGDDGSATTSLKKREATPEKAEDKAEGKGRAKVKDESQSPIKSPGKKRGKQEEEEEEEETFKWWEADANGDGSQKWTTLEHNGVLFPPPYERLPQTVRLHYDGKPVDLPAESEEVAGFFGAMLETDHAKDETFCKNFFKDFSDILKRYPPQDGTKIREFGLCDFTKMYDHFEAERARKKAMSAAEKKEIKAKKDEAESKYVFCTLDGRKEKVGNFRAEPPGLFRGRGEHPKKGALKLRLYPSDITLNIGADATIPVPNIPGNWGKVIHDNTVTWLAHWKENVNGNAKYVFLAAGSSLKGQSDMQKFEKARELKNHIDQVRKDYNKDLTSRVTVERQLATALYFIDRLALRAGNEKGEDEADTVGCCSLRYEHVTLQPPDKLVFDFLGKDSIRYYNVVDVEAQVFKNIRIFKGDGKTEGDAIFDRVTTTSINKFLTGYMKGLTAKVFRTYNASTTFQDQLEQRTPANGTLIEKLAAYNEANRMVAILCNHQKSVSKNHGAAMEKMENQIRAVKYQRRKLRYALFSMDKKYRKDPAYADDESDIDDDWIAQFEDESREKEIEKAKKKFEKDNEKRKADEETPYDEDVLRGRVEKINDEYDRLKTERGTKKAEIKGKKTEEALAAAIEKIDQKIKTEKFKMEDREKGKEVSLGTSKINYLDPRITTAWCKTHNVPVEKMFNKSLIIKFPWAMEVEPDWKF